MSGIAGIVHADGRPVARDALHRVADAAAIQGADGMTLWRDGPAGLIRFHHATTPEAVGEQQPRQGRSGAVIAFDGRLDNRPELLALLGPDGEALHQRADCDLALALFEKFGQRFLQYLVGDYALAIWQPQQRQLFCARSPAGWRPFFYTVDPHRFAFASDVRALIVGLDLKRSVNEAAVAEFLAGRIVTREDTFFQGVQILPQGSALEVRDGALRCWRWDEVPYEDFSRASEAEHVERFTDLFDQALIACSRSNTPVIAQLSGGLDSSSVLSRATLLYRSGRIAKPLGAITARFPGSVVDEGQWSSAVERHLGLTATVVSRRDFDVQAAYDWSAATLQMPLRPNTTETLQGIFLSMHSRGERVLLSGEGGDELLTGTNAHWPDELRRGRIDLIAREAFGSRKGKPVAAVRAMLAETLGPILSDVRYRRVVMRQWWAGQALPAWLNHQWANDTGLAERVQASKPLKTLSSFEAQSRYSMVDFVERSVSYVASHTFAARCGVEYRHPLYDQRLIRFYLGASGKILSGGGIPRHLFREAMRGTLIEEVRTRRTKAAFDTLILDAMDRVYAVRPIEEHWPVKLGWVKGDKLNDIRESVRQWRSAGAIGRPPLGAFRAMWSTAAVDTWLEHGFGL